MARSGPALKPVVLAAGLADVAKTRSGKAITTNTPYDGTSRRPRKTEGRPAHRRAPSLVPLGELPYR
ncbi:hypothetical protein [Streptomyces sp. NPDC088196]|uniref:hypothetical protein n=1 Tax=Streptomyces sp. NPDC088196 TaxID=3154868 RepID=UPI00344C9BF2